MKSKFHRVLGLIVLLLSAGDVFAQRAGITTAAGTGTAGFSGDSGPAVAALLNSPGSVAVDSAGNIYIADRNNHRIRRVAASTGAIATVAGNGSAGFAGDNGPTTLASLKEPSGVAIDGAGNLYIADFGNNRIRKVSAGTGIIGTVEVLQFFPRELLPGALDPFWYDIEGLLGLRFYRDGFAILVNLAGPVAVAVDSAGNLYIAEQIGQRIRKVALDTGFVTTIAGTGTAGFSGDGGPAASAEIHNPAHMAIDSAGNLYFSDSANHRIRRVAARTGIIATVAGSGPPGGPGGFRGDGGPAVSAQLNNPGGVAADSHGHLWIADTLNRRIRQVNGENGVIRTIAGGGNTGDGCAAATSSLESPQTAAVNASGNRIYIADAAANRIRLVALDGPVSPPVLDSITPSSGIAGTTLTVTLSGSRFFGGNGVAAVSACGPVTVTLDGTGVAVAGVDVNSDTSITATLTVAPDATEGRRDVTVATADGSSSPVQFLVMTAAPTLVSITPAVIVRGTSATLSLVGTNFGAQPDSTSVSASSHGISVSEVRVANSTSLTAVFAVAQDASLGNHGITVFTAAGYSNAVPITVQPESPAFIYDMPRILDPTQQTPIRVALARHFPDPVTATLALGFIPNATDAEDDPNVLFINGEASARTVSLTFPANIASAGLSLPDGVLSAGTVAGTIRLSLTDVQVGGIDVTPSNDAFDVEIPRLVPVITNVRILNRSSSGFDVEITGYSTSRDIGSATFEFGASKEANLLTLRLEPHVAQSFTTYYGSENSHAAGGAFVYLQPFIVRQGDANAVASVTVTLTNAQGVSQARTAQ